MNLYYYLNEQGQQCGPVQAAELSSLGVKDSTLVWTNGMSNWLPANQVPELAPYLAQPQPPAQPEPPIQPEPPAQPSYGAGYPSQDETAINPYGNQNSNPYNTPYGGPAYAGGPGSQQPPMPNNYLALAILSTIFCCLPTGIYAIVRANMVGSLYRAGDYEGAEKASKDAKTWSIISAVLGLIATIILVAANIFYHSQSHKDYNDDFYSDVDSYFSDDPATTEETSDYDYSDYNSSSQDDDSDMAVLRIAVESVKSGLPEYVGDGITLTDCVLTKEGLIYIAECDEDEIDIDLLNQMKSTFRDVMKEELLSEAESDPDYREVMDMCKKLHLGIGYKYVGASSGKSCTIMIPYTQL